MKARRGTGAEGSGPDFRATVAADGVRAEPGVLYVVATPLGNLGDVSLRALAILASVDLILAEDTRHTAKLLARVQVAASMQALHEHNERRVTPAVITRLKAGESVALVSDAGTPLISDPGFRLVRAAHEAGLRVSPVPGPSAVIAAMSVAGIAPDRFAFEGFLPARRERRRAQLQRLRHEQRTLVFYEAPHRIGETLEDLAAAFGGERRAAIARELTKLHETVRCDSLNGLHAWIAADAAQRRGEIVVLVEGSGDSSADAPAQDAWRILEVLARELPLARAVALAAEITGAKRNTLYRDALARLAKR